MCRAIVTIHAVHASNGGRIDLIRAVGGTKLRYGPLSISEANPRNLLSAIIRSNVLDLIADIHVPMDPADGPMSRIRPTHFHQHSNFMDAVGLIAEEMG